jgi:hypothetical protein
VRLSCRPSEKCVVTNKNFFDEFLQVGDILKDRFDAAAEVRLVHTANGQRAELQRRHVAFKEPNESDLVYSESSPDYCQQRADASGRFVTSGRRCVCFV